LSEGITLLTTTPSISPSLKDDRNQTPIEKGIKLQEPAATLVILETGALKLPRQLLATGTHSLEYGQETRPSQTPLPCLNRHIPERRARCKLHGRAKQPRESGSYRVGIARPEMDKEPPTPPTRAAGEIAGCNARTTQHAAGSSLASK